MKETSWIRERVKCSVHRLFGELRDLVEKNVGTMNEVCREISQKEFSFSQEDHSSFTVSLGEEIRLCRFHYVDKNDTIAVSMKTPDRNDSITTRWDAENSQCRVVVTPEKKEAEVEFPHNPGKVAQYILEPFFFFNLK